MYAENPDGLPIFFGEADFSQMIGEKIAAFVCSITTIVITAPPFTTARTTLHDIYHDYSFDIVQLSLTSLPAFYFAKQSTAELAPKPEEVYYGAAHITPQNLADLVQSHSNIKV